MKAITTAQLVRAAPGIAPDMAGAWADALSRGASVAAITTATAWAHWMGQLIHESGGFRIFQEDLSYSAERLTKVWPARFRTVAAAQPFARNPQALANRVYNGRMGNRVGTDDGWHFRGRGPKQLTGRDNYTAFNRWARGQGLLADDQDLQKTPELLMRPLFGAYSAAWFWSANRCGEPLKTLRGRAACEAITRRINGGLIGIEERWEATERLLRLWGGEL